METRTYKSKSGAEYELRKVKEGTRKAKRSSAGKPSAASKAGTVKPKRRSAGKSSQVSKAQRSARMKTRATKARARTAKRGSKRSGPGQMSMF
ncbi:MAG: hypothetical protein U0745_12735 [Polyangia bacterium]